MNIEQGIVAAIKSGDLATVFALADLGLSLREMGVTVSPDSSEEVLGLVGVPAAQPPLAVDRLAVERGERLEIQMLKDSIAEQYKRAYPNYVRMQMASDRIRQIENTWAHQS